MNTTHAQDLSATALAPAHADYDEQPPLVQGGLGFHDITELVAGHNEKKTPFGWWLAFLFAGGLATVFVISLAFQLWNGVGVWGNNVPVGWAWDIVNFVWWVGIGHAGTLISAVLFLFRQRWRTGINRAAEAMTIFAVICALLFPTFHVGRVWAIYWTLPIPNQMEMWPQFKSPLLWDVFAVSTYFTVSLVFWFIGLVPDLATLRDRAVMQGRTWAARIYGVLAMGWTGGNRHWRNYEKAYLILAGLSTPLVLSVHSVVSFDFAVSIIPGWHTTIFPPYFVAGAIFSGFAMVVTLLVVARKIYKLENVITLDHMEKMNIIILLTGTIVGFAYITEFFVAWYSGVEYESYQFFKVRWTGPFAWAYWTMMFCNLIFPQFFWSKRLRRSIPFMFLTSIIVNIGMWFERFVITVLSLHRDFLPSSWGYYSPTIVDVGFYVGSIGIFLTLFLLFLRWLPSVAMSEVKGILPEADPHFWHAHSGDGHAAGLEGTADAYVKSGEESQRHH